MSESKDSGEGCGCLLIILIVIGLIFMSEIKGCVIDIIRECRGEHTFEQSKSVNVNTQTECPHCGATIQTSRTSVLIGK